LRAEKSSVYQNTQGPRASQELIHAGDDYLKSNLRYHVYHDHVDVHRTTPILCPGALDALAPRCLFFGEIKIRFRYADGRKYIWPRRNVIEYLDDDAVSIYRNEYESHTFTIEFTYDDGRGGDTPLQALPRPQYTHRPDNKKEISKRK
jgi:hypothetical protein